MRDVVVEIASATHGTSIADWARLLGLSLSAAIGALVVALALFALFWAAKRATTVCVIDVRDGAVSLTRGKIAPRILADLGDITRRPNVGRGRIEVTRERNLARVQVEGDLTAAQAQQIRNVIGSVPLARLGSGGRAR